MDINIKYYLQCNYSLTVCLSRLETPVFDEKGLCHEGSNAKENTLFAGCHRPRDGMAPCWLEVGLLASLSLRWAPSLTHPSADHHILPCSGSAKVLRQRNFSRDLSRPIGRSLSHISLHDLIFPPKQEGRATTRRKGLSESMTRQRQHSPR